MRLSALKDDHGYNPNSQESRVFLDGKELKQCVTADEELGKALVNKLNEQGIAYIEPGTDKVARKWVKGKVEIKPSLNSRKSSNHGVIMETKILRKIEVALGSQAKYFDIKIDELLVKEDDYSSYSVSFEPKKVEDQEYNVVGGKHSFQFDIDELDDISLIFGEDTEMEVTAENIYQQLYWHEATEAV